MTHDPGLRQPSERGASAPIHAEPDGQRLAGAFLAHSRETPALLQAALDAAPESARLHATKALMLVLLARGELVGAARESAAHAARCLDAGAGPGEKAFVAAAGAAAHGAWRVAIDQIEAALADDPSDSLSVKMSHALRFMLGDKAGMLRSITRARRRLPAGHAHAGFLAGCHAFALEENGLYAEAEAAGRHAVALEPRDAWGLHAVSHVHEMTGRHAEGIRWIEAGADSFRHCNNFGGHLFWHLALFKLESGAIAEVFDLYDRRIRAEESDDFRDIANGASLLTRLELDGHDVGARWEELADKAEARLADRSLVFADLHYLLALIGAGRNAAALTLARSIGRAEPRHAAQVPVVERTGRALAEGLVHFADGDMDRALERLLAARGERVLIGGSDAQRDVFEQVLVEAALRAGAGDIARALLTERLRTRRRNRFAEERLRRLVAPGGRRKGMIGLAAALAFAAPAH
ncbi:tetratricopeptide repeat protein [Rhabdaerophilum calidifontis]|uniref:tetratricopeptide repeat protein n=1 Tax=Rhabdaerophilum calidifontis TaxID=2604328 RepID=UPI00123B9ACB|nr:tetratricopeptide repeat protein [Rhabdaerophilum calidifontis]